MKLHSHHYTSYSQAQFVCAWLVNNKSFEMGLKLGSFAK